MPKKENIALFDMDGTLCDFDKQIIEDLDKLRSPEEKIKKISTHDKSIPYLQNRKRLITDSEEWWANLPKLQLGFDVLKIAKDLGYYVSILTQGPKENPNAWSGKMKWLSKNLPGEDIIITRNKGLVYGKILVDDYPEYIKNWLKWRPRGLVIMPAGPDNKDFKHPQVIRYNGKNLSEVKKRMEEVMFKEDEFKEFKKK